MIMIVLPLTSARKAILIGNGDYEQNRLKNPVSDARELADVLMALGFDVTLKTNLNRREFRATIDAFSDGLSEDDEVVFFYSGHGIQVKGVNYLIPVSHDIKSESDIEYEAVEANWILSRIEKAKLNIFILDACRDNPYSGFKSQSRGLAQMSAKPGSTYIVFATSSGNVAQDGIGNNSPFTSALIKHIPTVDIKIEDMIKRVTNSVMEITKNAQCPWTTGNLKDDFYFLPSQTGDRNPNPILDKALNLQRKRNRGFFAKNWWWMTGIVTACGTAAYVSFSDSNQEVSPIPHCPGRPPNRR